METQLHVPVQPFDGFVGGADLEGAGFPRRFDRRFIDTRHLALSQPHAFFSGVGAVNVEGVITPADADGCDAWTRHMPGLPVYCIAARR